MRLILLSFVLILAATLTRADEPAVPTAEQALEKVKALVAETATRSPKTQVWVTVFGKQQKAPLLKADADGYSIEVMNNRMDQKWSKLSAEEIYHLAKGCVSDDTSSALIVFDYCLATSQFKAADEMLTLAAQNPKVSKDEIAARNRALAAVRGGGAKTASASNKEAPAEGAPAKSVTGSASPAKLDKSAALREVTDFSLAGMNKRLGPDYAFYHSGSSEKFPDVYLAPEKEDGKRKFQIGGPFTKEAGDYSSTQGQILYVPDSGFGVDRVTIIEMSHNCFTEKPLPPWWGGFRPEPATASWMKAGGPGAPVFMSRGTINWSNSGVIVFSTGLVGVAGTCTAKGAEPVLRLPPTKVPTAICITPKNEFALITVCDTEKMQGQLAVIALESSAKKSGFFHEWHDDHPGLPNVAVFTKMKLLGYVDLPSISVPTGVSAMGNYGGGRLSGPDGNIGILSQMDLGKQGTRDGFYKGNNSGYCASAGYAAIISRYEDKVAFVDLQPLFEKFREMYFTSEDNYQKTRDQGPDPKQWPYTFETEPAMKPAVAAVQPIPQPTAVLAAEQNGKNSRAFVATLDGKIGIFKVGGLATSDPVKPADIECVGTVQVGRNPCCLHQKRSNDTFLVVSRGDREISWVKYNDKGANVVRKLRDSKLIDPVNVEIADTHGIETSLITVADFKGRKILNYRCSEVRFATQGGAKFGMGPDGKDEFECGGFMDFPGSPFCISATNVN